LAGERCPLTATSALLKLVPREEIIIALRRHAAGENDDEDRPENYAGADDRNELLSFYPSRDGLEFSMWTQADRSTNQTSLASMSAFCSSDQPAQA
jgi:hypothetical protein